jgi:hypothetical protein
MLFIRVSSIYVYKKVEEKKSLTVGFKHFLKCVSKRAFNDEYFYFFAEHPRF